MKFAMSIILSIISISCSFAQNKNSPDYPEVGKPLPDVIIRDVNYWKSKTISSKDFKDKWTILDFWNKACVGCVASMPHVNSLAEKFKNNVNIFLVAEEDKEQEIRPLYKSLRNRLKLTLPCAFDSAVFRRLDIRQVPYILIIDPKGIVRAITGGKLTEDNLSQIIEGGHPIMPIGYREHETKREKWWDSEKPFLINGNGGNDTSFIFRSILTKWNKTMSAQLDGAFDLNGVIRSGRTQFVGISLEGLFFFAYLGQSAPSVRDLKGKLQYKRDEFFQHPILEIRDSSLFKKDYDKTEGYYCYSLSMPEQISNVDRVKHIMQNDLINYFGLSAKIESRKLPYLKLTANNEVKEKYKTRADSTYFKVTYLLSKLRNQPVSKIVALGQGLSDLAIVDETEITGNIDLDLAFLATSFEDYKKVLKQIGFDLTVDYKEMKCLVIRDIDYKSNTSK